MRITEAVRELWKEGYFKRHRSTITVAKVVLGKYGCTSSNTAAILNACKFLRKEKLGWIQKSAYDKNEAFATKQNMLSALKLHPEIIKVSQKLYADGHYAQAIFEAFKRVNNLVKEKSGRRDLDGKSLMQHVFSPSNPVLKFNDLSSQSEKDEQEGFMHLFAGAMLGIRNPKGHENIVQKDPDKALEYLVFASLLCRRLEEAKR